MDMLQLAVDEKTRSQNGATRFSLLRSLCLSFVLGVAVTNGAYGGPADIVMTPSPQAFVSTCQSYSMGLAMSFHPASPYKATTPKELRDLELRIRKEVEASAVKNNRSPKNPTHEDWRVAVDKVSGGKLKLSPATFKNLNEAMQFVAKTTGISAPGLLGTALAANLVKTPVLMSFHQIEGSDYRGKMQDGRPGNGSHIVTVLGVQMPPQTMGDEAKPKLLMVNSAVKFKNEQKNTCEVSDLSGDEKYSAVATLTDNYVRNDYSGTFLVNYIEAK